MPGFFKRAIAVSAGIVLGVAIVAGAGAWHPRSSKRDAAPVDGAAPPIVRERAPDTRA
jgi:hypothetical protein